MLLNLTFWFLFITTPIIAFYLLRTIGEKINQVSIINITVIALFVFSVLGTLPLFYFWDDYRVATGVNDQALVLKVLFYSCINILFFILGVVFVRKVVRLRPVPFVSSELIDLTKIQLLFLLLFFLLSVAFFCIYLSKINHIALFVVLTDGIKAAAIARSDMGNNFHGKYHWYRLGMYELASLITFTTYIIWLKNKRLKNLFSFLIVFSYSAFIAILATEKAPLIWIIIGLFMAYFLTKKNGMISTYTSFYFILFIVIFLVCIYMFFMGSSNIRSALWSVFSRSFAGSVSPVYFYLQYFPEHHDYLLGKSFPNPGGILPYKPVEFTTEVMNWKFPELAKMNIVGSMPTVFWGESYANFGPWGIPIVAFIMGLILSVISYLVSKIELNPVSTAFLVWLILNLKNLSVTGFSGYLYSFYIIVMTLITFIILFSKRKIRLRSL